MKVLVTVKRVTDPDVKVKLLPDGSGVDTGNVEYKINPFDEYALEESLRLRESNGDEIDEVVVVSVGSADATKELRIAMAMGADRAILVECDDANYDSSVIASILAAVVRKEEPGLVLMGKLAVDGENNQVSQMLARELGYGQGTAALSVVLRGNEVLLTRQADGGVITTSVKMPCIVSRADMPDEEVRYASLPGIMKAKRKPLDTLTPEELGVDTTSRTRILGYELPPARAAGQILETVDELVGKLRDDVKVL